MSTPSTPSAEIDAIERTIVDHLFELQPSYAVGLGLHEYDGRLPNFSFMSTERWIRTAEKLLEHLANIPTDPLSPARKTDAFLLRLLLESPLFDLRAVGDLERNPMNYLGSVSLTPYLSREYAPVPQRVKAVVQTLEQVPRLLGEGRARLRGPLPKPFIDLSLSIGSGLPAHFAEAEEFARPAQLSAEVHAARGPAEAAVAEFLAWLRDHELPKATAEFALGPNRYQELLFVREGIEAPFEEIRQAGIADLARNQNRLAAIAQANHRTVPDLIEELAHDHPTASELVPSAQAYVEEVREFVVGKSLVTVPAGARCRVEETPVYGRALSTASMNPPGPFDTTSSDGIFYVTPVDAKWSATQQEEWLRALNRSTLRNTTVHEVYPGHYLQFLHFRQTPGSLARKVYLSPSFVEGWAHYSEQLTIEQGIAEGNYRAEVAQLLDALLRDTRLLVSVGLHTDGMSLESAAQMFQREARMERLPAEREAIRGTFNPEYFCYTLGKLSILNARTRLLNSRFGGNLQSFHDALLALGSPPVGLLDALLAAPPAA